MHKHWYFYDPILVSTPKVSIKGSKIIKWPCANYSYSLETYITTPPPPWIFLELVKRIYPGMSYKEETRECSLISVKLIILIMKDKLDKTVS